jgi:hypothetical protein
LNLQATVFRKFPELAIAISSQASFEGVRTVIEAGVDNSTVSSRGVKTCRWLFLENYNTALWVSAQ